MRDERKETSYVAQIQTTSLLTIRRLDSIQNQLTKVQNTRSGQATLNNIGSSPLHKYDEAPGKIPECIFNQIHEKLADAADLYPDDLLTLRPLLKQENPPSSTFFHFLLPELMRLMRSNIAYAVAFTNYMLAAPISEVPQTTRDNLLHAVARELGAVSIDLREQETVQRQYVALERQQHVDTSELRALVEVSGAALGLFTKHFYNSGLFKQIESMLANLRSEMVHVHSIDLHTTYLPFLQELIGLMLMYGIPLTNTTYSSFFTSVLQEYFDRFIGLEPKQSNSTEHQVWTQRALTARATLMSFDHTYFREILGDRYDRDVLPALNQLPDCTSTLQAKSQLDPGMSAAAPRIKDLRTPVTKDNNKIESGLASLSIT